MLERTNAWQSRTHSPPTANAPLGWGAEYWIFDPTRYDGFAKLAETRSINGRRWTRHELAIELTHDLLDDVLAAAGGIEHSYNQLRHALADGQTAVDRHVRITPGVRHHFHSYEIVDASYAFSNMLTWTRALEDRVERREPRGLKLPNQGLLPALRPKRLRKHVQAAFDRFRLGHAAEVRHLANFTLHAGQARRAFQPGDATDGDLRLQIPDRVTERVSTYLCVTFNEARDALTFASELWEQVSAFIDDLLGAFERSVPKRLRKLPV